MSYGALIELLQTRLGLDPDSMGLATLRHGIDEACVSIGAPGPDKLLTCVLGSARDWRRFVDHMVVPETWFFRVNDQFEDLLRFVRQATQVPRPLRILSLPCATGEEAYSIAATLLSAGLTTRTFEILGIDVSERAVAAARDARYRKSALRGQALDQAWFSWQGETFSPLPTCRNAVRFQVGNVLSPTLLAQEAPFDIIFCRNPLIYLDAPARVRLIDQLLRHLAPHGMVFSGQAEVLSNLDPRLQPAPGFGALSFIRKPQAAAVLPPDPRAFVVKRTPLQALHARASRAKRNTEQRPEEAVELATADSTTALALVQKDADAGRLEVARAGCVALLEHDRENANVWFLLAMIELADGALEAAEHAFSRASYLDPAHQEATQRRASLAARLGRADEAAQLRARARRIQSPETPQ